MGGYRWVIVVLLRVARSSAQCWYWSQLRSSRWARHHRVPNPTAQVGGPA